MRRKWVIVGILSFFELLICVAAVALLWTGGADLSRVRFFTVTDTHVEETLEETFAVDGPAVLDVDLASDNVTVIGGAEGEVEVVAKLSLWGENEEDARRQLDVKMTQQGNRIVIRVERRFDAYFGILIHGSHVDFDIRVPEGTTLDLHTSSGDLVVRDVAGSADLRASSGRIAVEAFEGEMAISTSSGKVTLTGLGEGGAARVGTTSGDAVLRQVEADSLTVSASSGDLKLYDLDIGGDVEIGTSSGDVLLEGVAADTLAVHTSSGDIQASDGTLDGVLDLEATSGGVAATGVRAASYRLAASSGDIVLDGCAGRLDLRSVSGKIEVRDAERATLSVETSSGGFTFSGSLGSEEDHRIKSVSGDVRLTLPAGAAFDLDVGTVSGDIDTDFAVTMTAFDQRHVAGQVNGGGPLLQIGTSSGDVVLLQGEAR